MQQLSSKQLREFDPSIFHSEKGKKTKRLAQLVDEIIAQEDHRHDADVETE
jgi:hypothetical protein